MHTQLKVNRLQSRLSVSGLDNENIHWVDFLLAGRPSIPKPGWATINSIQDAMAKQLCAELVRDKAELASQAKSDFLMNLGHEIRTPMSAIIGMTDILMATELNDKQIQYIKVLHESADALMNIVNSLLDIGKIEAGILATEQMPFSMNVLLDQVATLMSVKAQEKGVSLILDATAKTHDIFIGESGHIRQILLNLIGNAIKFTAVGEVCISFAGSELENGKKRLSISVMDSGIGISKEKMDTIFERFSQADASIQAKYGGTGLGLSISKALAENMGGRITVSSVMGKGALFTLHLHLPLAGG